MAADPLAQVFSVRAFLAIPLYEIFPEEIKSVLRSLRHISGVKWVDPSQVHLTLHFFGPISMSDVERIDDSMKRIASYAAPFRLRLAGAGGFPDMDRPKVLWLGVEEKTGTLLLFQKILQAEVQRLGFAIEERPFHPHVTIGRVKGFPEGLKTLFAKNAGTLSSPEKISDHFVLYQSHCLPEGARYEILKTYPFSQKA